MKKAVYILFLFATILSACGSGTTPEKEATKHKEAATANDDVSVTDEENLATMPATCYQGNLEGDKLSMSLTIEKGQVTGKQLLIMEDVGVGEEANVTGSFLEGEFMLDVQVVDPRSGEVIETRKETWIMEPDKITKGSLELTKTECEGLIKDYME